MRLTLPVLRSRRGECAFTMVEIALSLAVVAFAMVAIMGVLPTGLQVQKDNREETIINADGTYLLEAIRTGNDRLGILSNAVYLVTLNFQNGNRQYIRNDDPNNPIHGQLLLGLLSAPRDDYSRDGLSNVVAWVRAFNSSAIDRDPDARDVAFRYQMQIEVQPFLAYPPGLTNELTTNQLARIQSLQTNLHEVRLIMRWPLFRDSVNAPQNARIGTRRRTFRTLVAGTLYTVTNRNSGIGRDRFFYFQPSTY